MCTGRLITFGTETNHLPQPLGLQPADVMVARSVLRSLAPTWTLDEHHDVDDGALMLMLTPPDPEGSAPTFLLTQHTDGIHVTTALGDSCETLLTKLTIRGAVWTTVDLHSRTTKMLAQEPQATDNSGHPAVNGTFPQ